MLLAVDGTHDRDAAGRRRRVAAAPGKPLDLRLRRDGKRPRSRSRPRRSTATRGSASRWAPAIDFPVRRQGRHRPGSIGGPSAGLMFSLAIYDTLTPGSLTGGQVIAGTGKIDADGTRRPDRRHPAEDRRRPRRRAPSCSWCRRTTAPTRSALDTGDMRLVRADTHARRRRGDQGLGRRPRRRPARRCRGARHDRRSTEPCTRPGAGRRRARDRAARRRRRLGPARPALRPGRHRARSSRSEPAAGRRDGPGRRRRRRARSPRSSRTRCPRTSRWRQVLESIVWPGERRRLRRGRRAAGAAPRAPTREIPDDPAEAAGLRPRAPGPPGGADRRRAPPAAGATYCALRLRAHDDDAVGGGRPRPGARAARRCCTRTPDDEESPVSGMFDEPRAARAAGADRSAAALAGRWSSPPVRAGRRFSSASPTSRPSGPSGCGSTRSATASVFSTLLWTRIGLFLVFGALMARRRRRSTSASPTGSGRSSARRPPSRPASTATATRSPRSAAGCWSASRCVTGRCSPARSASGQWRIYLLWRNGEPFGTEDPYFGKDIGFYVFDLPWLHYLVDFAMARRCRSALMAAAVVHYLYGGIRLQARGDRLSRRGAGAVLGAARRSSCSPRPSTTGSTASTW